VNALLLPRSPASLLKHISLRERINGCEEMPCCDGKYAEGQQSNQQECYAEKEASFAVHVCVNPIVLRLLRRAAKMISVAPCPPSPPILGGVRWSPPGLGE